MTERVISIKVNLDALRNELNRNLQKSIYFVGTGFQIKHPIDLNVLKLPTNSITVSFNAALDWDTEKIYKRYIEWILSNGFRDIIEDISAFLESAHKVLSFWELGKKQNKGTKVTRLDWNDTVIKGEDDFHWLGVAKKIVHFKNNHDIEINIKFQENILSINAARNCIVHRGGLIQKTDTNINNILEVKWTRLMMLLNRDGREEEFTLGKTVKTGDVIRIKNQEVSKRFNIGDRIIFTIEEFAGIAWSLYLFGEDVVNKINDIGVRDGFIKKPEEDKQNKNRLNVKLGFAPPN